MIGTLEKLTRLHHASDRTDGIEQNAASSTDGGECVVFRVKYRYVSVLLCTYVRIDALIDHFLPHLITYAAFKEPKVESE